MSALVGMNQIDYRILNSKEDLVRYYGSETFKHDNDIFEQISNC